MSATASIKIYIDWVRDAHAMEEQAESMLTRMAERLEHYPVLQQALLAISRRPASNSSWCVRYSTGWKSPTRRSRMQPPRWLPWDRL